MDIACVPLKNRITETYSFETVRSRNAYLYHTLTDRVEEIALYMCIMYTHLAPLILHINYSSKFEG